MRNPLIRILAAAGVLVFVLVAFVLREQAARAAGTEVVLPMEAVDPRALLTGHDVRLRLLQRLEPGAPCPPGAGAWIALTPAGDRHLVVGRAASREAALKLGPTAVRGDFACREDWTAPDSGPARQAVDLDLGVDRFHASQDEAERIEKVLGAQTPGAPVNAFAVVSAGKDGRARLKGLIVEGVRTNLTWW